ncbi:MAG: hypothetical protein V5A27_01085 [Halapricum sp.]
MSLVRGVVGVVGVVVGVVWLVELASRGIHAGVVFELLPPLALVFIGIEYASRHLLGGNS